MTKARQALWPERVATLTHEAGGTDSRRAYLSGRTVWIDWGVAGIYRVNMRTGLLEGARMWRMSSADLEFFRSCLAKDAKRKGGPLRPPARPK